MLSFKKPSHVKARLLIAAASLRGNPVEMIQMCVTQINLRLLLSFDCRLLRAPEDDCIQHDGGLIFLFLIPFQIPQWQTRRTERRGTAAMLAARTNITHNAVAIHFLFID